MKIDLTGKRAVVLGGANGIGLGVVEALAAAGANVMIGDIDVQAGSALAASSDNTIHFQPCDITRKQDVQDLVSASVDLWSGVDILVQVAGIYPDTMIEDISENEWDTVMALNVKGAFFGIQACFPHFKAQKYGRIVLTGSITGPHVAWPGHAHYASSKAALKGLARSAALEGAAHGITANVVEPGNVDTDNLRQERGDAHMQTMAESVPMKRLALPREIGNVVCFYASDLASYVTGTSLVLDGGQILPEARL